MIKRTVAERILPSKQTHYQYDDHSLVLHCNNSPEKMPTDSYAGKSPSAPAAVSTVHTHQRTNQSRLKTSQFPTPTTSTRTRIIAIALNKAVTAKPPQQRLSYRLPFPLPPRLPAPPFFSLPPVPFATTIASFSFALSLWSFPSFIGATTAPARTTTAGRVMSRTLCEVFHSPPIGWRKLRSYCSRDVNG